MNLGVGGGHFPFSRNQDSPGHLLMSSFIHMKLCQRRTGGQEYMLRQILKIVNGRPAFAMQVKINGIFPFAHPPLYRRFISLGEWEYKITAGDSYFISLDTGLDSHLTRLDYPKKKEVEPLSSQQKTLLIITMRK